MKRETVIGIGLVAAGVLVALYVYRRYQASGVEAPEYIEGGPSYLVYNQPKGEQNPASNPTEPAGTGFRVTPFQLGQSVPSINIRMGDINVAAPKASNAAAMLAAFLRQQSAAGPGGIQPHTQACLPTCGCNSANTGSLGRSQLVSSNTARAAAAARTSAMVSNMRSM